LREEITSQFVFILSQITFSKQSVAVELNDFNHLSNLYKEPYY